MASRDAARAEAQPGTTLVVVHDFKARSADELSLSKGDKIELIERDDDFNDGWFLGRHIHSGTTGLFPEVYTAVAPKASISQSMTALRRTSGSMPNAVQAQEASSVLPRPASASTISTMQQRPISGASTFSKPSSTTTRSSLPSDNKMISLSNATSPVMHETLTVIDEHMNDMHPGALRTANRRDTMGSMYSSHPSRMSYIAGHETEDEEGQLHTEAEVLSWTSAQVAEYLEDHGVERSHCKVFREQEITGEVLLAMDQSSIFLKEFDLGPVGRRLRTWHKIKALQDEAQRNNTGPGASNLIITPHELEANEVVGRNRSTSASAAVTNSRNVAPLRSSNTPTYATTSPAMSRSNSGGSGLLSPQRADTTYRPSAQNIRTMQHWRHSSVDSTATSIDGSFATGHRKQSSIDQRSQLNGKASHSHNVSTDTTPYLHKEPVFASSTTGSPVDLEKGYYSSTEADSRNRKGNVLQKKSTSSAAGSVHSRSGSFLSYARRSNPVNRGASTDSLHDPIVSPISSPNSTTGAFGQKAGTSRTISMPTYSNKAMSTVNESAHPIVTKLEPYRSPTGSSSTNLSAMPASGLSSGATTPDGDYTSPSKDDTSTPSTGAASFDLKSGSRTSAGSGTGFTPQPTPRRAKPKTKKSTSAYTRGLEKKSPAEQMVDCDYSGWMKKKSGSLMTTWKPRLFVLRGRRLSYYYSENDTEEKGLIDISFHNVMPATDEKMTLMHATVTGASSAATSPHDMLTTTAQQELRENPPQPGTNDDNLFIFKLTPPKSGRGVNFTKPTVHYFAVNSRQEGRLWMAALMKAVIARDQDGVVTTTYNQETISLAKARARRERPPALKDEGFADQDEYEQNNFASGLGIDGLKSDHIPPHDGAFSVDRSFMTEDNRSSITGSTVPTAAPSIITDLGDLEKDQLVKILH
ncbi:hypothetical protein AMS68_002542 [Peltaster fructicola]|uniref:Uncharacterized protein n=1 Tax=Peltaster fructicola TaxID=286661 RepID=A0A6H0XQW3_9PEZI|nr:hypothetical protein AMS68_002542 [Peltaster fructicola]